MTRMTQIYTDFILLKIKYIRVLIKVLSVKICVIRVIRVLLRQPPDDYKAFSLNLMAVAGSGKSKGFGLHEKSLIFVLFF